MKKHLKNMNKRFQKNSYKYLQNAKQWNNLGRIVKLPKYEFIEKVHPLEA